MLLEAVADRLESFVGIAGMVAERRIARARMTGKSRERTGQKVIGAVLMSRLGRMEDDVVGLKYDLPLAPCCDKTSPAVLYPSVLNY